MTKALELDSIVQVEDWGLIPYREALSKQLEYVDEISKLKRNPTLILCSHPPIVTLGRSFVEGDLCGWNGDVERVSRGGRATYHGPSQLILYPLLNLGLSEGFGKLRKNDVVGVIRLLEEALVKTLQDFQLKAHGKSISPQETKRTLSVQGFEPEKLQDTGVWINGKKIASVGIAVKSWVSYHGMALNYYQDAKAFSGINPCGYQAEVMTSLEQILGNHLPDIGFFKEKLIKTFLFLLSTSA